LQKFSFFSKKAIEKEVEIMVKGPFSIKFFSVLAIILIGCGSICLFAQPQEAGKLAGTWQMVVEAEGQYYYLILVLKETEGKLEGTISEASGFFKDVSLTNIKLEAERLSFEFTVPTPPDGLSRMVAADLKVGQDYEKMEGSIHIPDLGISAPTTLTRQKN